jgi:hypothetical protein
MFFLVCSFRKSFPPLRSSNLKNQPAVRKDSHPLHSSLHQLLQGFRIRDKLLILLVGAEGFEPPTLWSQTRCATRLRYAPTLNSLPHSSAATQKP